MTLDFRPVAYVIGLLVACLGGTMIFPLLIDLYDGNGHWPVFLEAMLMTVLAGGLTSLATAHTASAGLDIRQNFLLTALIWLILPVFGALPLMLGETGLSFTDGFFEAMSGLTTTGATVVSGLDDLPRGILLWRGILQWLGGVGIVVVAMVFLPELKVGGMQIFKSESFDTLGKILPRAAEMAAQISVIYVALTAICALFYLLTGMNEFDAIVHAMTTLATGGMANSDASFGAYGAGAHYVGATFMLLAALPFVRFVQLTRGSARPLFRDRQVGVFLMTYGTIVLILSLYLAFHSGRLTEEDFREVVFNVSSILTGTGYASADYGSWGSFAVMMFFCIGLIGGCAGSTACSVKIFRYQLLLTSVRVQIRSLHAPHAVFVPRYEGRPVSREVLNSVMAFFLAFLLLMGLSAVALSMTGLDFITSVSGAATAMANIGPGLGPEIGPSGNFAGLPDSAKWILAITMLVGRLEIMTVLVLFTFAFWRD